MGRTRRYDANEIEPYAYLRWLFAELPAAETVEQFEAGPFYAALGVSLPIVFP